jgi:hypothetical protein
MRKADWLASQWVEATTPKVPMSSGRVVKVRMTAYMRRDACRVNGIDSGPSRSDIARLATGKFESV